MDDELNLAHDHCYGNRSEVLASEVCGCFSCLEIFLPTDIVKWTEEYEPPLFEGNVLTARPKIEPTAICPKCDIDSVIGSRSGYPITIDFLSRLEERWFKPSK